MRQYSWLSIHAPTRGATVDVPPEWFVPITFNPRSYKRSDFLLSCFLYTSIPFNPRSYKRSDRYKIILSSPPTLSIHAPTRGATSLFLFSFSVTSLSIHAPTRGATLHNYLTLCYVKAFNPRSYKRSDVKIKIGFDMLVLSIHAPTRGATFIIFFWFIP